MKMIKYLSGVLSWIWLSGCHGFLTEVDPSNFELDNYYKTAAHAESAVIAIYQDLYPIHDDQSWAVLEFQTGIANTNFAGDGGLPNFQHIKNLDNNSDHSSLRTFWNSHYRGIANANVALARLPDVPMGDAAKARLIGEARFLRAYYYFNLVRMFGEVPLIRDAVDLSSPELYPGRADEASVFDLIVEDLTAAEGSGLPFKDERGRVSIGAVKTMLSYVYLTMAGQPLNKGQAYYQLAAAKAAEVISSGQFSLFNRYDDLHLESTDNKGEHIFMVQFEEFNKPSNALQQGLIPFRRGISQYSNEHGIIYAQKEFVESYDPSDLRAKERQFFFTKFTSESNRNDTIALGNYHVYKLLNLEAHLVKGRSGLNWPVYRFTDVLLNLAEASNEAGGPTPEAYAALNAVRKRAGLPDLEGLSADAFRAAVLRERWYEHCFEGKLWFDMVRTRKAFNVLTKTFEPYVGHKFVYGPVLTERELRYPIPANEIRNNPNLEQNKGY